MKSKKRHRDSSEESEESDASIKSSSTSESDSDDSSLSEPRHKKKKKRADSSDSDSNSDQKRVKKRKHKKKKKKHSKKKRRSDSLDDISDDAISISDDGEISSKKRRKHKHKHSKRAHSSVSEDERFENHGERRLHSVVKERRASSEAGSQPSRTYYQKEYLEPASTDNYIREQEIQKFYRGTSKEKRDYRDNYNTYERERSDRYATHEDKFRQRDKYGQGSHFTSNQEYSGRPREYDEYKRPVRYEEPRREDHYKRERETQFEPRGELRGNNKYNRYEEKAIKSQEYDDRRDYRDRRPPVEPDRVKEYEKRDKYREERPSLERSRDVRRDRPGRLEKPPVSSQYKERSRSRSEEDRAYKEKRREERDDKGRDRNKDEREERPRDRYKEERDERDERRERPRRSAERDRRRPDKPEPFKPRERKTRFDNGNDGKEYSWGKTDDKKDGDKSQAEKEKPNFGLSGKLTADANTVNGVVIKYTEPDDAKQPKRRWRFYPFKGDKALPILYIHRQSSFLIGRDKKVVDIALEHPSISKQHAALQYRATPFTRADGSQGRRVRPYIIDLESANGTFVNNKRVEARRYVELLERDVVKFGFSAREYVLLHENSKDDAQDDDQEPAAAVVTVDRVKQEKRAKEAAAADGD